MRPRPVTTFDGEQLVATLANFWRKVGGLPGRGSSPWCINTISLRPQVATGRHLDTAPSLNASGTAQVRATRRSTSQFFGVIHPVRPRCQPQRLNCRFAGKIEFVHPQVVAGEPVLAHQPAEAAAEREAGDAGLETRPPVVARPKACVSWSSRPSWRPAAPSRCVCRD